MAFTAEQVVALQSALASGELEVEFNGRRVRYRSTKEIKEALATIEGQIAQASTTPPVRQYLTYARSGLE